MIDPASAARMNFAPSEHLHSLRAASSLASHRLVLSSAKLETRRKICRFLRCLTRRMIAKSSASDAFTATMESRTVQFNTDGVRYQGPSPLSRFATWPNKTVINDEGQIVN
jgi:hypothetical protein